MALSNGARIRLAEITASLGQAAQICAPVPWGAYPWGSRAITLGSGATDTVVRVSDLGYVDEADRPYPPYLKDGIDLSRALTLSSDALGGSLSIGTMTLTNGNGYLDNLLANAVIDHLPVTVWQGARPLNGADPTRSSFAVLFSGLAKNWKPALNAVSFDMLDVTYWLEGAMTVGAYGGGGRLDGDSNVKGKNMPRLRGVVCNITPILIDSVNYVYQISDGPASVTALYEGGYAGGIQYAGMVADIYAASPAAGTYTIQTGATGTWFRLGTKPVYAITLDAVGQFRSGKAPSGVLDVLRQMLLEDMGIPATYIDAGWVENSAVAPWSGGWYWDGSSSVTGKSVTTTLLSGLGISLVPSRRGTLLPVGLAAPAKNDSVKLRITVDIATNVTPVALDASLDPPTWRWRIGYQHNFTLQGSGSTLHPQATADRLSLVAQQDRTALWVNMKLRESYRVPNDPAPITTALADQDDALLVAEAHGQLWGVQRRLWAVDIPQDYALQLDLGDLVAIQLPIPGIRDGAPGIVVGEHINATDLTTTLTILV